MARRGNPGVAAAINRLIAEMAQDREERRERDQRQEHVPPPPPPPPPPVVDDTLKRLDRFEKRHPPHFHGGYDPEGAQNWLRDSEKIFRVLQCNDTDKVMFATYTLRGDAEHWWEGNRSRLEAEGVEITWAIFQELFLEKYFPDDVREQKEMEFLSLTQGNMSVGEYASKFEELSRYYTPYQNLVDDRTRCVKFINGLKPIIKEAVRMQAIHHFPTLVNTCRVFEEDHQDRISKMKGFGPQRSQKRVFDRKKPYQPSQRSSGQSASSVEFVQKSAATGSSTPASVKCFKCGGPHFARECPERAKGVICYQCHKVGHISRDCPEKQKDKNASETRK